MGAVNVKTPEDPVPDRSKKWSRDEVASLVTSEIVSLSEEHLVALSPFVVALEAFTTDTGPGSDGQSCWLIAREGDRVLYWDGVEEQFATAKLTDGTLRDRTLCGEKLEGCLRHFIGAQRPGQ
jgi:F420-0:gamma-glutamyl ligase